MIKPGMKIIREFKRPEAALVECFAGMPVANIADNMGRLSCLHHSIRPFNRASLLGVAFTISVPQGDNLLFHKALDLAQPGDVLMVAGNGYQNRSLCGEIMVHYARMKKLAGFVIDGAIRDVDAISQLEDFPVYGTGVQPNGPYKNGPGEINVPVSMGGVVVSPGDIVVGDADGVVIVKPEDAAWLLEVVAAFHRKEEETITALCRGEGLDRNWVDETLKKLGYEVE